MRNFSEGALFRGIGDTTRGASLLRAHAVRTTVGQAAVFGSPFVGLLLFRAGGATAVFLGICALLVGALVILAFVPELERESEPVAVMRENVSDGLRSLRGNSLLRKIGWASLTWNVFAGAAFGIMPAVLASTWGWTRSTPGDVHRRCPRRRPAHAPRRPHVPAPRRADLHVPLRR